MVAHRMIGYLTLSSLSDELMDIRQALSHLGDKTVLEFIT